MKAYVYIMANRMDGVLYIGLTSNLKDRVKNHKAKKYPNSFSAQYNTDKLMYYETFDTIIKAQAREKQLKAGNRATKVKLIESTNPDWIDLSLSWNN